MNSLDIEIRKMIAQDEKTKNLKIDDDDLLTIYNYLKNKNKENEYGYHLELKTNPYLRVVLVPTIKSKAIQFKEHWQTQNQLFDSDINFEKYSLNKLIINNEIKQQVLQKMKQIIKNFDKIEKGFYLYGNFHTGKTTFLKTLAQELIKKQSSVMFLFMPDVIRKFKNFLNSSLLETRFQQLKNVHYLFLDDLGSENMTPWFRDEILLPLLHNRIEKKLPIFISSNLKLQELEKHLSDDINNSRNCFKVYKIIHKINILTQFYDFSEKETS